MMKLGHTLKTAGSAGVALLALASAALADGYEGGSKDAAPAAEGRKLTWSITLGATSDYVFRGISLTNEDPAAQGSIDLAYGIFYMGVWGSNLGSGGHTALGPAEVDVYAGIKPVLGPVTFDFGVVGYIYPGDNEELVTVGDDEYLELKAGASFAPFKDATAGVTVYYSPEYQLLEDADAIAVEGTAGYTFRQVGIFVPTLSGVLGYQKVEDTDFGDGVGSFDEEYIYWNVGLALAVEKFTIDMRYWDTDIDEDNILHGLADERFVGTVKVALP